jgi:hypothetical protein
MPNPLEFGLDRPYSCSIAILACSSNLLAIIGECQRLPNRTGLIPAGGQEVGAMSPIGANGGNTEPIDRQI